MKKQPTLLLLLLVSLTMPVYGEQRTNGNNATPASANNGLISQSTHISELEDALQKHKDMLEKGELEETFKVLQSKYLNGLYLLKKKDRVGGCRDVSIAITMFERYRARYEIYYGGDGGGEYELKRAATKNLHDELEELMRASRRMYC